MHRAQDTEINDQDKELERFTDEIDTEEGNPPPLSNDLLSESDMTLSLLGVDDIADMDLITDADESNVRANLEKLDLPQLQPEPLETSATTMNITNDMQGLLQDTNGMRNDTVPILTTRMQTPTATLLKCKKVDPSD